MPTREDMLSLHQALTSGDVETANTLAPMFGLNASDIQEAPDQIISAIEGRADQLGIALTAEPFTGGATRSFAPETTLQRGRSILDAFGQGMQRGGFGGSPDPRFFDLPVGPPEGAIPLTRTPERIAEGVGMVTPAATALMTGGRSVAGPAAARLAAARNPIIRALGPGSVRGGLGEAGFEAASAAGGVQRDPSQILSNLGFGFGLGPALGIARRLLPAGRGTGGAIRRAQEASRRAPAPPTAPAAAIPEAGVGQVGGETAQDVTTRARTAVQEALDPNNVLAPETTATSRVRTSMKKPRGRPHKKPKPPEGEKAVKAKPPRRKEAGKKPTPPKRRKNTASERLREKARKGELG